MPASTSTIPVVPDTRPPVRPPFGFVEGREYQREHPDEWPSWESLRWFMRQNRVELVEAGAVGLWKGVLVLDPGPFEAASKKILSRNALESLERRSGRRRGNGDATGN